MAGWHKIKRRRSDHMFSRFIRARDNGRCKKCHVYLGETAANLHCSHFHSRSHKSIRWDPRNGDAMCASCHRYWESHKTEYEAWKLEQMGQKEYDLLWVARNSVGSDDETLARLYVKQLIKELESERGIKVQL